MAARGSGGGGSPRSVSMPSGMGPSMARPMGPMGPPSGFSRPPSAPWAPYPGYPGHPPRPRPPYGPPGAYYDSTIFPTFFSTTELYDPGQVWGVFISDEDEPAAEFDSYADAVNWARSYIGNLPYQIVQAG